MPIPAPAITTTDVARFPQIKSKDLNGHAVTLPQDLPGERSVVILGWQRDQQPSIESWAKAMAPSAGAAWLSVPVIDTSNHFLRMIISSSMRHGIPNHAWWPHIVALYTRKADFNRTVGVADEAKVQALVVDRAGNILERVVGDYTEAGADRLRAALR
ncbi:hypothetical protein Terro_4052 [Terriglobus roseus DSM 18391]|uniref:Peroxiredoxin n=1 Tax=Terriglobus roseus (strain DSM 18391 / NRRL B-41598 / KBS 63) TaxID=926566 RepID=I3ZLZ1_TERRK|nr:hypothetical protein [Terriglobus roseus]AFL90259.1 hypothetical protein Terro_4052 [Terriglobus roseus DSM 18391]